MSLLSALFACRHRRVSFPMRIKRGRFFGPLHVCCLSCGKEFGYDWRSMTRLGELADAPTVDARTVRVREA